MASAEQLRALIESHVRGDDERFHLVALQVAADEAKRGHGRLAGELRGLVEHHPRHAKGADEVRDTSPATRKPVPIFQPQGTLAELLVAECPDVRLSQLVLPTALRARLERVLRESRGREKLQRRGLEPRRKLLLMGPPGSGKTYTASALAGELALPLFTVRLDGLLSKYLGETSIRLRSIFEALGATRGVYLFDEFDAIGVERGSGADVGEIRRVLTTFLQLLELDESDSLIVAATNHGDALDGALFRRFDDVLRYGLPEPTLLIAAMKTHLMTVDTRGVDWQRVQPNAEGLSFAELASACNDAAKLAVLDDVNELPTDYLIDALRERRREASPESRG